MPYEIYLALVLQQIQGDSDPIAQPQGIRLAGAQTRPRGGKTMTDSSQPAATLTIASGPSAGRRFDIGAMTVTIGRHDQCDIQVEDRWLSRRHARIAWSGSGYVIEDR
jgi:pSer/pThr/pTyr-binding forkhead associated (FHA) protein